MLGEGPISNCVGKVFRVANRGRHVDAQRRVMPADIVEQPRQVFFEMPALGEEQRDYRDVPDVLRGQSGNGRFEGWLHQFQKRQLHTNAGLPLAQPCRDAAERLGPSRITRAVGKQKDGGSWIRAQWSARSHLKVLHHKVHRAQRKCKCE